MKVRGARAEGASVSLPNPVREAPSPVAAWLAPALILFFFGSGFAALVYEVVWFQLLEYVVGVSAISVGILLAVYMGGLALGSMLSSRLATLIKGPPLRVYGLLELGIGVIGLVVLFAMPVVSGLYRGTGATGVVDLVLRAVIAGFLLLPPTMLMGATLPTVAGWVKASPREIAKLGRLYSANIAGAVAGCFTAGFYLLRVHDIATTTYVAVAVNFAVGALALALSSRWSAEPGRMKAAVGSSTPSLPWSVLTCIALSGLTALGAEVVWTRLMSLLLGQTVYTFSIILGVLLSGLAFGSAWGTARARVTTDPGRDLGICQLLLTVAIAWAGLMLGRSLPFWPIAPALSTSPRIGFQLDLIRCLWVIVPAAWLWGASFPLALAASGSAGDDPRRVVAIIYLANTVGALFGALAFTFWIVPSVGTHGAERFLIVIAGVSSLVSLLLAVGEGRKPGGIARPALIAAAVVLPVALAVVVPPPPGELVAYGRNLANRLGTRDVRTQALIPIPPMLYVGEGMNESVAVSGDDQVRLFHVSGKIEASSSIKDMRLQRMLGDVPALLHPEPHSVLIVGFGAGVTSGTFVPYPSIKRIVICELEPLVPTRVAEYFRAENNNVVSDPRVSIVYDDARHFLLTTREKFDIITSDPIHPWVKGSAALYSREYFDLVRSRLNPGGVVSQWLPLYQSSEATIRGEVATFFSAFPGGTLWANNVGGQGYDMVMVGSNRPQVFQLDSLNTRLRRPDHRGVVQSLSALGYSSPADFLATYAGREQDLSRWLAGAQINHDRRLWLQYQAGLETFVEDEARIYQSLSTYRVFPEDLFVGSEDLRAEIRGAGARGQ